MDNAAVGADGHIDAGLLKILVPCSGHFNQRRGLAAANALLLTGDADGAAANADFHEIGSGLSQIEEALAVHHITSAHLDGVAVVLADIVNGPFLPDGVSLGGIDAENVGTGLDQGGDPLGKVPGVDARAHHIALAAVLQAQGMVLVVGVVLAEDKVHQMAVIVDDGQGIELVLPDDVIGFFEVGGGGGGNQPLDGGHKVPDGDILSHAGYAVITAGDHAQQFAVGGAVGGNS